MPLLSPLIVQMTFELYSPCRPSSWLGSVVALYAVKFFSPMRRLTMSADPHSADDDGVEVATGSAAAEEVVAAADVGGD